MKIKGNYFLFLFWGSSLLICYADSKQKKNVIDFTSSLPDSHLEM